MPTSDEESDKSISSKSDSSQRSKKSKSVCDGNLEEPLSSDSSDTCLEDLDCEDGTQENDNSFAADICGDFSGGDYAKALNKIAKVTEEAQELYQRFAKKFETLDINIDWNIAKSFKAKKGVYKSKVKDAPRDTLTKEEKDYLWKRLVKFCKENKLNPEDFALLKSTWPNHICQLTNEMRIKFIQYLSRDLAHRTPRTIISYLSRIGSRKGKFSPLEDDLLVDIYQSYAGPNLNLVCAVLLHRSRQSIYKRFVKLKEIRNVGKRPVLPPKKSPSGRSYGILDSCVRRNGLSGSKWRSIASENRLSPALSRAIYFCDLFPRLGSASSIPYYKLCENIILRLNQELDWEDVDWTRIGNKLGINDILLYCLYRKLVQKYVPSKNWKNLKKCQEYLMTEALPDLAALHASSELYSLGIRIVDK